MKWLCLFLAKRTFQNACVCSCALGAVSVLTPFVSGAQGAADTPPIIFDMDSVQHRPGETVDVNKRPMPVGTVQLVEGKFGKAVQFSFSSTTAGFMTAPVRPSAVWDRCDGFSFYLKGDGSTNWGGLELIDRNDYSLRYGYCFPLDSIDWRKVTVRWDELTPELAGALVNTAGGYAPSGFGNFWFGKWFYWRDFPAHSFAVDQLALERSLPAESKEPTGWEPGLKRIQARLRSGKPVTIVTMGDSLTDNRHWANAQTPWPEVLARRLEEDFHSKVRLVDPAIGGTTLSQNLVLMPRWTRATPRPDLVLVWFGYNDWDSGVRGKRFHEYLALCVDRIRKQTQGAADVALLTCCPAFARWDTMRELEEAVREVGREKQVAVADVAVEFRLTGSADAAMAQQYWAWDKTHLGKKGHEVVAATVFRLLKL